MWLLEGALKIFTAREKRILIGQIYPAMEAAVGGALYVNKLNQLILGQKWRNTVEPAGKYVRFNFTCITILT